MRFSLFIFLLTSTAAVAAAADVSVCPPDELRVARCENVEAPKDPMPPLRIEQMLVCQNAKRDFSLRVRYFEKNAKDLVETPPIPATADPKRDSSVEYYTTLGFGMILSASREQAVLRHCIPVPPSQGKPASFDCVESHAICK